MRNINWKWLLFPLVTCGIIAELIVIFFVPHSITIVPTKAIIPTHVPIAKNPNIISGDIGTISLGTIDIPPSGKPGNILITGLLKNVYSKNNKIYADIVFKDAADTLHENSNIVVSPDSQSHFLLSFQSTPQIFAPPTELKEQNLSPTQIQPALQKLVGNILIWNFGAMVPTITSIPQQARNRGQIMHPYFSCNQEFLHNLQTNNFLFPPCELYTSIGSIYVTNTK